MSQPITYTRSRGIRLTADGLRGKVSWLFKLLTVFAVVLSFIGIYWWYLGRT